VGYLVEDQHALEGGGVDVHAVAEAFLVDAGVELELALLALPEAEEVAASLDDDFLLVLAEVDDVEVRVVQRYDEQRVRVEAGHLGDFFLAQADGFFGRLRASAVCSDLEERDEAFVVAHHVEPLVDVVDRGDLAVLQLEDFVRPEYVHRVDVHALADYSPADYCRDG